MGVVERDPGLPAVGRASQASVQVGTVGANVLNALNSRSVRAPIGPATVSGRAVCFAQGSKLGGRRACCRLVPGVLCAGLFASCADVTGPEAVRADASVGSPRQGSSDAPADAGRSTSRDAALRDDAAAPPSRDSEAQVDSGATRDQLSGLVSVFHRWGAWPEARPLRTQSVATFYARPAEAQGTFKEAWTLLDRLELGQCSEAPLRTWPAASVDAGRLTLRRGADKTVVIAKKQGATGVFYSAEHYDLFESDRRYRLHAAGSEQMSEFGVDLQSPGRTTLTEPQVDASQPPHTVNRSQPFKLRWDSSGDGELFVALYQFRGSITSATIAKMFLCRPAAAGIDIPVEILAKLPRRSLGTVNVGRRVRHVLSVTALQAPVVADVAAVAYFAVRYEGPAAPGSLCSPASAGDCPVCDEGEERSCGSTQAGCLPGIQTCVDGRWLPCQGHTASPECRE